MTIKNNYYVYVYFDPRTVPPEPIYVGKGIGKRYLKHLTKTHNVQLAGKIKHIKEAKLDVIIERPHENLFCAEALDLETQLIAKYGRKDLGLGTLCNYTNGGEGTEGHKHSPETIELLSKQRKDKPQTEAQYAANCARIVSDETRKKMSEANQGHSRHTSNQIEAIIQSNKTRSVSDETRQKMSQTRKGRKQSPEHIEAVKKAKTLRKINLEHKLKNTIEIKLGDSIDLLKKLNDGSIDLIITSPPYADQRKATYGGVHPDKYVEWFLPFSKEMLRVLKPTGTFILNIKEKVVDGERHTYVLELIIALRKQGWLWTEEFIWHKKNCFPGKWPNRFRDAWERCLQFNKKKDFAMYQDEVKIPIGDWANTRLKNLSDKDKQRDESAVESGFGKKVSNWVGKETVYPTNVIHLATECGNKDHSAAFPSGLPEWFIKLFSKENDLVLDPFAGSGTTLFVANELNRNSIGLELQKDYVDKIKDQIKALKDK